MHNAIVFIADVAMKLMMLLSHKTIVSIAFRLICCHRHDDQMKQMQRFIEQCGVEKFALLQLLKSSSFFIWFSIVAMAANKKATFTTTQRNGKLLCFEGLHYI